MKIKILVFFATLVILLPVSGQGRSELEALRKKNLEEIEYVDKLLRNTSSEKKENMSELRVIGKKLGLREKIINEYGQEISLLEYRIYLNRLAEELMEDDLIELKSEYEKSILNAFKSSKGTPIVAFVLSSSDFNQGYKRLRYIQQIAKYRRNEADLINQIYFELQTTREKLENDKKSVVDLRSKEERQKEMLRSEQQKKERLINSLNKKEKQLKQELEEKKRISKQIESEISRLIEEERKKSAITPMSSEMKLIGDSFSENKGRLPWPVNKGIITSHFGLQKHPVLKNFTEDNIGIEITSSGRTSVNAVFKGQVLRVFAISGANLAVIVRHGKFLTVYQNIVNVKVKVGETIATGQEIGEVFIDSSDNEKAILKFMVYEEKTKLNPELWIIKK